MLFQIYVVNIIRSNTWYQKTSRFFEERLGIWGFQAGRRLRAIFCVAVEELDGTVLKFEFNEL